jgi:peptidoglycan hydrolase-like protein with peptidoglycan-binding domain
MKKARILSGILAAVLILLAAASACADLKKGSRGEEVKELQQQMIDLGVLEGSADGIYGKKTVAAVKKLQQYWGKKQNGRADRAFLDSLNDLWHLALGNGTESGVDPEDLEDPVMSCAHNESAPYGFDYCYRHEEGKALRDLLNPGKGRKVPEGLKKVILKRIREYWLEAIRLTYDEWEESDLPGADIAGEQKELFEQGWAEAEPDLAGQNGGAGKIRTLEAQAEWLETIGIETCFDLHGAEPNNAE